MDNIDNLRDSEKSESPKEDVDMLWTIRVKEITDFDIQVSDVDPNGTVEHLKKKIMENTGLEVDRQRMIFRGKVLQDEVQIQEYGIKNGDCVHLLKKVVLPPSPVGENLGTPTNNRHAGYTNITRRPRRSIYIPNEGSNNNLNLNSLDGNSGLNVDDIPESFNYEENPSRSILRNDTNDVENRFNQGSMDLLDFLTRDTSSNIPLPTIPETREEAVQTPTHAPLPNGGAPSNGIAAETSINNANPRAFGFDSDELHRMINEQLSRAVNRSGNTNAARGNANRLGRPFPTGDNIEHLYQNLATLETLRGIHTDFDESREETKENDLKERLEEERRREDVLFSVDGGSEKEITTGLLLGTRNLPTKSKLNRDPVSEDDYSVEEKVNSASGLTDFLGGSSSPKRRLRRFKVGQWIDCLDTVNQWLEATVTQVSRNGERVKVHYNGWGTRWDEFIDVNSPRIARFRTKSKNHANCKNVSPTLSHWIDSMPRLVTQPNHRLEDFLPRASVVVQSLLGRINEIVSNDDYKVFETRGQAEDEKTISLLKLAPEMDLVGRTLVDLSQAIARRPRFKRRYDYLRVRASPISLVKMSLLPFGFKTNFQKDRKANGSWNKWHFWELVKRFGLDSNFCGLQHPPSKVGNGARRARNLELHLHAIVASDWRRPPEDMAPEQDDDEDDELGGTRAADDSMFPAIADSDAQDERTHREQEEIEPSAELEPVDPVELDEIQEGFEQISEALQVVKRRWMDLQRRERHQQAQISRHDIEQLVDDMEQNVSNEISFLMEKLAAKEENLPEE